jgi:hypothetical protein
MRKVWLLLAGGATLLCERFESEWGVDMRVKGKLFIIVLFSISSLSLSLWIVAVCTRQRRRRRKNLKMIMTDTSRTCRDAAIRPRTAVHRSQSRRDRDHALQSLQQERPMRLAERWQGMFNVFFYFPTKVITFFFSSKFKSNFHISNFFFVCVRWNLCVCASNLLVRFGFEWIARRNLPWEIRMG